MRPHLGLERRGVALVVCGASPGEQCDQRGAFGVGELRHELLNLVGRGGLLAKSRRDRRGVGADLASRMVVGSRY
jgi:hypothetical protein